MLEKDLLFEIKPKYSIGYTIFMHLGDIAVIMIILMILRFTA